MLRSILLKGSIDQTLTYPVGSIVKIYEGEWQLALSTISFLYDKKEKTNPIPREILTLTTNFIMAEDINERSEVILAPAILSMVKFGAANNAKSTIGFRNQNFFKVNNPQQELQLDLKTVDTKKTTEGASVFILLLLRRVR